MTDQKQEEQVGKNLAIKEADKKREAPKIAFL
jgi:hypothetical protein